MTYKKKPSYFCDDCGVRLMGLIPNPSHPNHPPIPDPQAKRLSSHFPLCSRCWERITEEGRQYRARRKRKSWEVGKILQTLEE